jgi:FtsP/CotA-like multicopper oxidase with cupredoxin domain
MVPLDALQGSVDRVVFANGRREVYQTAADGTIKVTVYAADQTVVAHVEGIPNMAAALEWVRTVNRKADKR